MTLEFSSRARADLVAIADFIEPHNPLLALSFVDEIEARYRRLSLFPHQGERVPGFEGVRRIVHGRYLIFYRVEKGRIVILTIMGGEMDLDHLLF